MAGAASIDARKALEQYQDFLAPTLDVYEQAVYLYILRHSRLQGKPRLTVELKSARHQIAKGLGRHRSPLSASTCMDKLKSLDAKGCIKLLKARNASPAVRVFLPSEIPGLVGALDDRDLETMDFFNVAEHRRRILEREGARCFYCLRKLNDSNTVFDHVAPRPIRDNSYRNVVASCRRCNNRKGESSAENLLRVLFRESAIRSDVLGDRLGALEDLREGRLKPGARSERGSNGAGE